MLKTRDIAAGMTFDDGASAALFSCFFLPVVRVLGTARCRPIQLSTLWEGKSLVFGMGRMDHGHLDGRDSSKVGQYLYIFWTIIRLSGVLMACGYGRHPRLIRWNYIRPGDGEPVYTHRGYSLQNGLVDVCSSRDGSLHK